MVELIATPAAYLPISFPIGGPHLPNCARALRSPFFLINNIMKHLCMLILFIPFMSSADIVDDKWYKFKRWEPVIKGHLVDEEEGKYRSYAYQLGIQYNTDTDDYLQVYYENQVQVDLTSKEFSVNNLSIQDRRKVIFYFEYNF